MSNPNPDKLQVLWKKGRNYFTSFFVELAQVRKEIGNDKAFANWCFDDLHIGLSVLMNISDVLKKTDAAIVKQDLAAARDTERAEKAAKRAAEQKAKAEARAEKELKKAQKKEQEKRERKRKSDRESKRRKKQRLQQAYINSATNGSGKNIALSDRELINRIKSILSRFDTARNEWIEASLELASLLCYARAKHKSNNAFSAWLDKNEININHQDRAALINLGSNLNAMRRTLETTNRISYRHIWQDAIRSLPSN